MIVKIAQHKTVPTIAIVTAGPELAHEMGRFAFARWQPQHKAFWVEEQHLETMTRILQRDGHTVIDERHTGVEEKFSGPLPECRSCGQAASRRASLTLNRCAKCGDTWHPVIHAQDVVAVGLAAVCEGCGRTQRGRFPFCGNCGASMPAPRPAGARPVDLAPDRQPLQDPLLIGACIPEHLGVEVEEEPRERYP